jgi:hypothetical protein
MDAGGSSALTLIPQPSAAFSNIDELLCTSIELCDFVPYLYNSRPKVCLFKKFERKLHFRPIANKHYLPSALLWQFRRLTHRFRPRRGLSTARGEFIQPSSPSISYHAASKYSGGRADHADIIPPSIPRAVSCNIATSKQRHGQRITDRIGQSSNRLPES